MKKRSWEFDENELDISEDALFAPKGQPAPSGAPEPVPVLKPYDGAEMVTAGFKTLEEMKPFQETRLPTPEVSMPGPGGVMPSINVTGAPLENKKGFLTRMGNYLKRGVVNLWNVVPSGVSGAAEALSSLPRVPQEDEAANFFILNQAQSAAFKDPMTPAQLNNAMNLDVIPWGKEKRSNEDDVLHLTAKNIAKETDALQRWSIEAFPGAAPSLQQVMTTPGYGWTDFAEMAASGVFENAPQMLLSIAGGWAGAKALGWGVRGATALGVGSAMTQEAAGIYQDIHQKTGELRPGVATVFGVAAGALELPFLTAVNTRLGSLFGAKVAGEIGKRAFQEGALTYIFKSALKDAATEGVTEGFQTIIEKSALRWVSEKFPMLTAENGYEVAQAVLIGGILGGITGFSSATLQRMKGQGPEALTEEYIPPSRAKVEVIENFIEPEFWRMDMEASQEQQERQFMDGLLQIDYTGEQEQTQPKQLHDLRTDEDVIGGLENVFTEEALQKESDDLYDAQDYPDLVSDEPTDEEMLKIDPNWIKHSGLSSLESDIATLSEKGMSPSEIVSSIKSQRPHSNVTVREVENTVESLKEIGILSNTPSAINLPYDAPAPAEKSLGERAVDFLKTQKQVSTPAIQKALNISFNQASNLLDEFERLGMVSPQDQSNKRVVTIPDATESPVSVTSEAKQAPEVKVSPKVQAVIEELNPSGGVTIVPTEKRPGTMTVSGGTAQAPEVKISPKKEDAKPPLGDIVVKSLETGKETKIPVTDESKAPSAPVQKVIEKLGSKPATSSQPEGLHYIEEIKGKPGRYEVMVIRNGKPVALPPPVSGPGAVNEGLHKQLAQQIANNENRKAQDGVHYIEEIKGRKGRYAVKVKRDGIVETLAVPVTPTRAGVQLGYTQDEAQKIADEKNTDGVSATSDVISTPEEKSDERQNSPSPEQDGVAPTEAERMGSASPELSGGSRPESAQGTSESGNAEEGGVSDRGKPERHNRGTAKPRDVVRRSKERKPGDVALQPSGENDGPTGVSGEVSSTPKDPRKLDFVHDPNDSALEGKISPKERFQNNLSAIRLLKTLAEENRLATAEEQRVLALYSGWGPLPQAFVKGHSSDIYYRYIEEYNKTPEEAFEKAWEYGFGSWNRPTQTDLDWKERRKELLATMTQEQYEAARASTINAHFTAPALVRAIWSGLAAMGFNGGRVLEPAIGSGLFVSNMPPGIRSRSGVTGIDMDTTSAELSKHLFQRAKIINKPFQEVALPDNFFDLIVSNVPFADVAISHKGKPYDKFLLHDYYFARSLDLVRPGGIVAFITSKGTMDKQGKRVREIISNDYRNSDGTSRPGFDLLAAIRYPRNAFKDIANTEVVTDLLILRKRTAVDLPVKGIPSDLVEMDGANGAKVRVNRYYSENPKNLLGTLDLQGSMYGSDEPSMAPIEGLDLSEETSKILSAIKIEEDISGKNETANEPVIAEIPLHSYAVKDGKVVQNVKGVLTEPEHLSEKEKKLVRAYVPLQAATSEILAKMADPKTSEEDIKTLQKKLKQEYDKFYKAHGRANDPANKRVLESDPLSGRVLALEKVEQKLVGEKKVKGNSVPVYKNVVVGLAEIFEKRTIRAVPEIESVQNPADAIIVSLTQKGRLDIGYMAKLLGKSEEQTQQEMLDNGLAFSDPSTGAVIQREEYLSGEVKIKLAAAKAAAEIDPKYAKNVSELEKVLPKDVPADQIKIDLGAPWIPPETYRNFFVPHFGMRGKQSGFTLTYSKELGGWIVGLDGITADKGAEWGVANTNYGWDDLLKDTLSLKTPDIAILVQTPTGISKDKEASAKATAVAIQKQRALRQAFRDHLEANPETKKELAKVYNDIYNGYVLREYDGSGLMFPNMDRTVFNGGDVRKNQRDGVWRMLFGGNVGIGHVVGAGKTYTAIAGVMELRRLGLKRKPCVVVPNHLTQQWAMDFLRLYPTAKVLSPGEDDFKATNRRNLVSRIATGDWDVVILPESQFKRINVKQETQAKFIDWQIEQITTAIHASEAEENPGGRGKKSRTVKQLEKQIEKLNEKMKGLLAQARDPGTTFEETGIDYLVVDEAHHFKNLFYSTRMNNVRGLGNPEGSGQAADLFMKINWLRSLSGNSGVASFLTGTPISNSISEIYAMMRYLSPEILDHYGISTFDGWAATFAVPETNLEREIAGTYRAKTRLKFQNVPELVRAFKGTWDIKTQKDIQLPRPEIEGGEPQLVLLPQSEAQKTFAAEVLRRSESIRKQKGPPQKGQDNMLALGTDASLGTLDLRLLNDSNPADPGGKLPAVVTRALDIYHRTTPAKLVQVIFLDRQSPGKKSAKKVKDSSGNVSIVQPRSQFDSYQEVKDKLIAGGVPAGEIAFIHDYPSKSDKQALFDKVNSGDIRFLLGTTEKMGAGTNIQKRLVAIHRLVPPWRPSDLEQGDGRLLRPGNLINSLGFKGMIYNYSVADSFDAWMWDTLARKQIMNDRVLLGDPNVREIDDVSEDQQSMFKKWADETVQDPDQKRLVELQDKMMILSAEEQEHDSFMRNTRRKIQSLEAGIRFGSNDIKRLQDAQAENYTPGKEYADFKIETLDPDLKKKLKAAKTLEEKNLALAERLKAGSKDPAAEYNLTISFGPFEFFVRGTSADWKRNGSNVFNYAPTPTDGNILEKIYYQVSPRGLATKIREAVAKKEELEKQLVAAEEDSAKPFKKQEEFDAIVAEFTALSDKIAKKNAEAEVVVETASDDDTDSDEESSDDGESTSSGLGRRGRGFNYGADTLYVSAKWAAQGLRDAWNWAKDFTGDFLKFAREAARKYGDKLKGKLAAMWGDVLAVRSGRRGMAVNPGDVPAGLTQALFNIVDWATSSVQHTDFLLRDYPDVANQIEKIYGDRREFNDKWEKTLQEIESSLSPDDYELVVDMLEGRVQSAPQHVTEAARKLKAMFATIHDTLRSSGAKIGKVANYWPHYSIADVAAEPDPEALEAIWAERAKDPAYQKKMRGSSWFRSEIKRNEKATREYSTDVPKVARAYVRGASKRIFFGPISQFMARQAMEDQIRAKKAELADLERNPDPRSRESAEYLQVEIEALRARAMMMQYGKALAGAEKMERWRRDLIHNSIMLDLGGADMFESALPHFLIRTFGKLNAKLGIGAAHSGRAVRETTDALTGLWAKALFLFNWGSGLTNLSQSGITAGDTGLLNTAKALTTTFLHLEGWDEPFRNGAIRDDDFFAAYIEKKAKGASLWEYVVRNPMKGSEVLNRLIAYHAGVAELLSRDSNATPEQKKQAGVDSINSSQFDLRDWNRNYLSKTILSPLAFLSNFNIYMLEKILKLYKGLDKMRPGKDGIVTVAKWAAASGIPLVAVYMIGRMLGYDLERKLNPFNNPYFGPLPVLAGGLVNRVAQLVKWAAGPGKVADAADFVSTRAVDSANNDSPGSIAVRQVEDLSGLAYDAIKQVLGTGGKMGYEDLKKAAVGVISTTVPGGLALTKAGKGAANLYRGTVGRDKTPTDAVTEVLRQLGIYRNTEVDAAKLARVKRILGAKAEKEKREPKPKTALQVLQAEKRKKLAAIRAKLNPKKAK